MAKKLDPIKEAGLEVKLNTPIGVGQYLYLEQPDFEYNSAGDWKVKLFLDPTKDEVKTMMAEMDELLEKAMVYFTDKAETPKKKKLVRPSDNTPYYFETDDDDEPTGRIFLNPKSIASGTTSEGETWKRQMPIFDAAGVRVTEKLNAGSGTTMRVSLLLRAYFNVQSGVGVSLRLTAVQIIDLKQFGGGVRTAEDAGFGKVEGGFSADSFESPTEPDAPTEASVEANEDEDAGQY